MEKAEIYDFLIVGGGPAGATIARMIDPKFKTALLEAGSKTDPGKLCGGLIAPDAQKMLGKFGLSLSKDILVDPQMFFVESHDLQTGNSQKYQRFYLNVDRKRFDSWLLSLIPSRVEQHLATEYLRHETEGNVISVLARKQGQQLIFKTRHLIAADGGQSLVRRRTVKDFPRINKYVSLQAEFNSMKPQTGFQVYFDRSLTDFYGWSIQKKESLVVGMALKGKGAKERFESYISQIKPGTELRRSSCTIIRPGKFSDFRTHFQSNVFFIGEAAGFISPSSAEGISYAFKSAELLANAINHGPSIASSYWFSTLKIKTGLLVKKLKSMVIYNKILRNLIFMIGIAKL
jgi:geranylgeranyl reductase